MGTLLLPKPIDILPHRPPFLFLDRVSKLEESSVVGWRFFGESEYFFEGHFPQRPVVPGVILLESMAQFSMAKSVFGSVVPM